MNALAWFIALVASIALAFFGFTEQQGDTWTLLGWASIGLSLLCFVMFMDALLDDIRTGGGFK